MADFQSVIESIGDKVNGSKDNTVSNGDHNTTEDSEEEIDEKELEEQVSDLVEIRNKEMLKRNLRIIVRENLVLKAKLKKLESKVKDNSASEESYSMLFRIDLDGDFDEDQEVPVGDADRVLSNSVEEEVVVEEKKGNTNKCWNCEGDHVINDCTEPRDQKAIARNRREFQSKTATSVRYHVDERFSHLKPGLPSDKLRSALRLGKDQVPEYIYRMRALGYPPGWLQAAKIDSSGIIMYHEKEVKSKEAGEEDGEIKEEVDKTKYNMEKLIEWAGFNSPLPEVYTDETKKYRAMSYSAVKTLKKMKEELRPKEQKGYVRRKMKDTSTARKVSEEEDGELIVLDSTEDDSVIILDSSVEEDNEGVKKDISLIVLDSTGFGDDIEGVETELTSQGTSTPLKLSIKPSPETTEPMSTPSLEETNSVSTASLEAKNPASTPSIEATNPASTSSIEATNPVITPSLEAANSVSTPNLEETNSVSTPNLEETNSVSTPNLEETNPVSTPSKEATNPMSTPSRQTSISSSQSSSISKTEIGTPIVELHSPFTILPSQGSFGKEMSEHIVFENLPDYTGKWDQMKGLISKIRKRKIEPDEDEDQEME